MEVPKAEATKERPKRQKLKNDPKFVAAARELRDRYLEQVNSQQNGLLDHTCQAKYDVVRQIDDAAAGKPIRMIAS